MYILQNTTYNIWTPKQYNIININARFKHLAVTYQTRLIILSVYNHYDIYSSTEQNVC